MCELGIRTGLLRPKLEDCEEDPQSGIYQSWALVVRQRIAENGGNERKVGVESEGGRWYAMSESCDMRNVGHRLGTDILTIRIAFNSERKHGLRCPMCTQILTSSITSSSRFLINGKAARFSFRYPSLRSTVRTGRIEQGSGRRNHVRYGRGYRRKRTKYD